ncbi:MFS transporter [Bifidobacterium oedipodis]|uniref:MFS transporter n=1 Tax=Bifidobacterium oedipodis TaxID=2675322 RepID=A0A7Y0HSN0_9BIFI|nr:glycoside-pentoside-hexuronide (GPH):cation symporter [Bifidobacterium sp. DSM 109957]NMM93768.1 MFS transporter [Bifidobacterium sp. DSM 109957]
MGVSSQAVRPFGFRDKAGYMFGDFGNDFMFLFASSFLMVFYTRVMGIPGAVVGTLFLVARIIDAFADVTVGIVVDRSRSSDKGKYRVAMMKMAAPAAIFSFLMYQTFCIDQSMGVRIAYMSVTYIIWGILYSCVNIPYGSMASVLSDKPEDRTSLSTFRTVGSSCANMVIGVGAPLIIYETVDGHQIIRGGEGTQIFMWVSLVFAICSIACYFACYRLTTERVKAEDHSAQEGQSAIGQVAGMLKSAFASRSMIGIIGAAIALLMAMLFLQQMANYLYTDYFGSASVLATVNLIASLMTFVIAPFASPLAKRFGHKAMGCFGSTLGMVGMGLLYVLHTDNVILFSAVYLCTFFGIGCFNIVIWAMITDVIDDIEVSSGMREDATCYSVYSFARKLGQAFAGWFSGAALTWIGYQEGATAVQSQETLDGLYMYVTLLPTIFFALVLVILLFIYPLSKKRVEENTAALQAKRLTADM